jgi:hypothetical protein
MPYPDQPSAVIAIQVSDPRQLINSLDPSPFRKRDLDPDAEQHIVGWARELPRNAPIVISVHMPAAAAKTTEEEELKETIATHFLNAATGCDRELRELLRIGRIQLLIGLLVLLVCIAAGQLLITEFGDSAPVQFINQGLLILGWVANWRPIETFLYGWWPIVRHRRLFLRLAAADVRLILS